MTVINAHLVNDQVDKERARHGITYTDTTTPDSISSICTDMFSFISSCKQTVRRASHATSEFEEWARANELPHFEETGCWLLNSGSTFGDYPKNWYYILLDGGTGELYYYYYHREKPFEQFILSHRNADWFIQEVIMPAIVTYCVRHNLTWQKPVEETPADS